MDFTTKILTEGPGIITLLKAALAEASRAAMNCWQTFGELKRLLKCVFKLQLQDATSYPGRASILLVIS